MKARPAALCALLLTVGLAATAPAADNDAGLRSVFARGAGERALGLGGAYGAVGGDPTALYWNPAGLGGLQRPAVAAAYTDLIGLGFHEEYGVLALPGWRLGTFALSLRGYGVDGIEGRDDRGTLTDDNLRNRESELTLGYGRALGEAWQVGAAFKMQRQELANQSGSGFGLDAGLAVRPALALGATSDLARGFNLGVTFRNIVEPTIRLLNDDVHDPSAVRVGGALAVPLGSQLGGLVAVDWEKTKEMDGRLHAGLELTILEVLALRGGTNAGMLTAGLGATWRGLTANYAFEDNELSAVHRFGLTVSFGATVAERRQASLDRREAEMNQRLAQAFAAEQQQRVATVVRSVRSALSAGDYATALERVRALQVVDPDHPAAPTLEAAAFYGLGQQNEARGDLAEAALAYQRCMRVDPSHVEAHEALARVVVESQRRSAHDESVRAAYSGAMEAFGAGDLARAQTLFAQALSLAPDDAELQKLAAHVDEAIRLQTEVAAARTAAAARANPVRSGPAAAAAEPAPRIEKPVVASVPQPTYADLSPERRREVADLYERGVAAANSGRRDDALRYWEMVWNAAPDYQQVRDHLRQEYQARGMDAFAEGSLDRAIEVWEQALAVDPENARTRGYLERAYEHRTRIEQIRDGGR